MGYKQSALTSIIESKTQEKLLLAHKLELCKQPPSVNPVLAGGGQHTLILWTYSFQGNAAP